MENMILDQQFQPAHHRTQALWAGECYQPVYKAQSTIAAYVRQRCRVPDFMVYRGISQGSLFGNDICASVISNVQHGRVVRTCNFWHFLAKEESQAHLQQRVLETKHNQEV